MVSLTRYRSAQAPTTGGPPAPADQAGTRSDLYSATRYLELPADFEAFLANQVAQPSGYFKKHGEAGAAARATFDSVRYGSLSVVALAEEARDIDRLRDNQQENKDVERRAAPARGEDKSAVEPVADPKAPVESYWLVEGSQAEVKELLRGLAEYAKRSGLERRTPRGRPDAACPPRGGARRSTRGQRARDAVPAEGAGTVGTVGTAGQGEGARRRGVDARRVALPRAAAEVTPGEGTRVLRPASCAARAFRV
jgi:glycine/D-amino acid oxidase-like deaminating enzyme